MMASTAKFRDISKVVALVTGGASGLGRATAVRLASLGAKVIIGDLQTSNGDKIAQEIGENAVFVAMDVTSESDVKNAVQVAMERFGGINVAVNCAGIFGMLMPTLTEKGPHPLEEFQRILQVNTVGTFNVIRLAAEQMSKLEPYNESGERGVIVNTASVVAFEGPSGFAAYAASKAAVVGMALPIARDLKQCGIRVCTIAPGLFDTPMAAALPEAMCKEIARSVPFPQRLGDPDEYAHLVQALIENPVMNAEVIRLDGALRVV